MIKAAYVPDEAGNGESGSAQIFCHPDMRAVLIEVRLPVSRISLFFIERLCLLLGMEDHTPAAQHADLRFCGGQHTGAEAVPAVLFSDGDPSDDIFPLRMPWEKAACRSGDIFYIQDQMSGGSVRLVKLIVKSLLFHKDFFPDRNCISGERVVNSDIHFFKIPSFENRYDRM